MFVFAVFVVVAVVSVVVIVIVIVVVVVVNKLQSRKELSLPVAHGCGCRRSQISHLVQPHYFYPKIEISWLILSFLKLSFE